MTSEVRPLHAVLPRRDKDSLNSTVAPTSSFLAARHSARPCLTAPFSPDNTRLLRGSPSLPLVLLVIRRFSPARLFAFPLFSCFEEVSFLLPSPSLQADGENQLVHAAFGEEGAFQILFTRLFYSYIL